MSIIHKAHSRYVHTGEQNNSLGSTRNHTRVITSSISSLSRWTDLLFSSVGYGGFFDEVIIQEWIQMVEKFMNLQGFGRKISWPKPGIIVPLVACTDCGKIRTASFPDLSTYWINNNRLKGSINSNEKGSFHTMPPCIPAPKILATKLIFEIMYTVDTKNTCILCYYALHTFCVHRPMPTTKADVQILRFFRSNTLGSTSLQTKD